MAMKVTLSGEQRTIYLLKTFDKDAYERIGKKMLEAGDLVADQAREDTPSGNALRNWGRWNDKGFGRWVPLAPGETRDLSYSGQRVHKGIKTNLTQDKQKFGHNFFYVRVVTMNPGGAAYTLSGSRRARRKSGKVYQGMTFVDNLNRKHGTEYPRGLLSAIKKKQDAARPLLEEAMRDAKVAVNRKLNG